MSGRDKTEVTIDFKTGDKEIPKDSEGTAPVKCANVTFLIFFWGKSRISAADLPKSSTFSSILKKIHKLYFSR